DDVRVGAQLEVLLLHQVGQHRGLRARLRAHLATEELAIAAVDAGIDRRAVFVGIGTGDRGARRRERLVAHLFGRLLEQRAGVRALERRVRVLARARTLERVAAGDDLAVEIAGLAADAVEILEAVVVALELVVGDAPVLAGAVFRKLALAVARERAAARLEVPGQEAPGEPAPVHRGAAHALAGAERAELAHRQRGLGGVVPERDGLAREALHQLVAAAEA